ncbi:MAG TPA: hypothetical protein VFU63_01130, partial [Ktedonobacterales bacterium]|nr:hypothetical protein [Ktedonobacterales bacterium]
MAIRTVVFDIGGILEIIPGGGDPTIRFPEMIAHWETHLGMPPGELHARITALDERIKGMGKNGEDGTLSEAVWIEELRLATGWNQATIDAFM